jgi:hypothetical protein
MQKPGIFLSWLLFSLLNLPGLSQIPIFHGDIRSKGMSDINVMLANEWSVLNNPAGLTGVNSKTICLAYENYFELPELGTGCIAYCTKAGKTGYGMSFSSSGYAYFKQYHATAGLGMYLTSHLTAGVAFHYIQINQPYEFGNRYAFVPSLGVQWTTKKLSLGFYTFNPAVQQYQPTGPKVESEIVMGIGYHFDDNFILCAETEKSTTMKITLSVGFETVIKKCLFFRFGISSNPLEKYSLGLGYKINRLIIDLAVTKHPVLEYNTAISISLQIDRNRKKL